MDFNRPLPGEYAPFYEGYLSLVPGNPMDLLAAQSETFPAYLRAIPDTLAGYRYAEGKWTVRQVAGHIIDTERIMAYRALRIMRGDMTELPGFDENHYAGNNRTGGRTLADLADEFAAVRRASLFLFRYTDTDEWQRRGVAAGAPVSARALLYIIVGHVQHHLAIYEDRYFKR